MWFDDLESEKLIQNSAELKHFIENCADIFNSEECNYTITEEYPPVLGAEMVYSHKKIKFTTLLIRNKEMDFDDFKSHHKKRHMPLFSSIPIIKRNVKKYVVSHKIENSNCKKDYDGIVEFWFDSFFDTLMVFVNPKYLLKVRPDEKRFLNLSKCDFILTKECIENHRIL
jgi:uncharacterized membrane protein